MSTLQIGVRREAMERYLLLSELVTLQIGKVDEEADRGVSGPAYRAYSRLPFYQDKLHEPVLYTRFQEILQKVSHSPRLNVKLRPGASQQIAK